MNEAFQQLGHSILQTFGQSVLLTLADSSTRQELGIIKTEVVELGKYDAIQGEITVLTVDSAVPITRGAMVQAGGQTYDIDRKIKDNGSLAKWNIYAH